jgi:hypothetical protein
VLELARKVNSKSPVKVRTTVKETGRVRSETAKTA